MASAHDEFIVDEYGLKEDGAETRYEHKEKISMEREINMQLITEGRSSKGQTIHCILKSVPTTTLHQVV